MRADVRVGDLRESGAEILPETDLGVAAAGVLGDECQAGVGQVRHQCRLQAAWP